jgi:hypothetical protein
MIRATLRIRCLNCGQEEVVEELLENGTIDLNLDKVCPVCRRGWMVKRELTMGNASTGGKE